MILSTADIFFQNQFVSCCCFFGNISRVPNSLDPDHARHFVGPDLEIVCKGNQQKTLVCKGFMRQFKLES